MEQGHLVNGSLGKIADFKTAREAKNEGVEIAESESREDYSSKKSKRKKIDSNENKPAVTVKSEGIEKPEYDELTVWPIVRFTNGRQLMCMPDSFSSENARGNVEATRHQVHLLVLDAMQCADAH